jgi:predicted DNA-binding transcriptional regulator AlpA
MQGNDRLLRLPAVLSILSISRSSWWLGIREGRFPRPIKLGQRTSAWRESDIRALFAKKDEG